MAAEGVCHIVVVTLALLYGQFTQIGTQFGRLSGEAPVHDSTSALRTRAAAIGVVFLTWYVQLDVLACEKSHDNRRA
jgi:hypothetical protein